MTEWVKAGAHYENKLVFEFRVKEKGEGTYELVFLGLQDLNSNDEGKLDAKFECGNGNIIEDFLKNQLMKIFLKWYKDTINQKIEKSIEAFVKDKNFKVKLARSS
uniref:Uncharacterized protein n=1 Tax=Acrobeloides nanus TaxID=290746 RepID=A0A914DDC4_9BILA